MAKVDKRVQAIIHAAQQALKHLRDRTEVPRKLAIEIDGHIRNSLSTLNPSLVASRVDEIDAYGTDIWNAAADIIHEDKEPREPRSQAASMVSVGVSLRVFSLLLLDLSHCASSRRTKNRAQQVRLFKVSNRTAKLCLERKQLDLSVTALEVGSKHISRPAEPGPLVEFSSTDGPPLSAHEVSMKSLECEYYLLRILHAWRSERRDLADHFFHSWTKVHMPEGSPRIDASVKAADLFYEFARQLAKKGDAEVAAKWYDRALAALWDGDPELAGHDSGELLTSIAVAYGKMINDVLLGQR